MSNDVIFKLVFSHHDIVKWFLNRVFGKIFDEIRVINGQNSKPISENMIIELIRQELMKENVCVKTKIVDLLVKVDNCIYNIEFNNKYDDDVKKRNLVYIANVYSNSLRFGQSYLVQPCCTQINLCGKITGNIGREVNYLRGSNFNKIFVNNLCVYEFDIAYYKKILYTGNKKLINENLHLIMFACNDKELGMLEEYDDIMKKIHDLVKKYNDDSTIYQFMTNEEDQEKMNRTKLIRAEQKGIQMGISQGIEQGIEKNKIDTAYSLLCENVPLDIISRTTGFSCDYLKSIKN